MLVCRYAATERVLFKATSSTRESQQLVMTSLTATKESQQFVKTLRTTSLCWLTKTSRVKTVLRSLSARRRLTHALVQSCCREQYLLGPWLIISASDRQSVSARSSAIFIEKTTSITFTLIRISFSDHRPSFGSKEKSCKCIMTFTINTLLLHHYYALLQHHYIIITYY